jgi:hypothetical protein
LWFHFELQNVRDKAIRGYEVRYLETYERYRLEGEENVSLNDVHLFPGDWTETWAVCHGDVPADVADPGKLYIAT